MAGWFFKIFSASVLLLLLCPLALAQPNAFRSYTLSITTDTTQLDTLSIVPRSLVLRNEQGRVIPDTLYAVDYANARLISKLRVENASAAFRVFPLSFGRAYFSKEQSSYVNADISSPEKSPYFIPRKRDGLLANSGLEHSGSLMRGVNLSANSSASVTSEMNLQLSGKLTDELSILATISDKNLPVTPEGNTASLQEFDKIFISVYTNRTSLTAGDLDMVEAVDFFGKYQRKSLGASFATRQKKMNLSYQTSAAVGVSKGKFVRQTLTVVDGSQGPYLLRGAEGEEYIVVLSGSERVYVDGLLQERGADADYTISYATAEITFTPRRAITRSSRVVVELEYSERSYARYLLTSQNRLQGEKLKLYLNAFYEGDDKNQPIDEAMSDTQRQLMSNVGAQHWQAVVPNADSSAFSTLVTPKRKLLLTAGGVFTPDSLSSVALDAALSNSSVNLFSSHPQASGTGVGVNVDGSRTWQLNANSSLATGAKVLAFDESFSTPERFTTAEYERDWNVEGGLQQRSLQQYTGLVGYRYGQSFSLTTTASLLNLNATHPELSPMDTSFSSMQGKRLTADLMFRQRKLLGTAWGSFLRTQQSSRATQFARGTAELAQSFGKLTVGFREELERNEVRSSDTLAHSSQAFHTEELFLRTDSSAHRARVAASLRTDFLPRSGALEKAIVTREVNALSAVGNEAVQSKLTVSFRNVRYADSAATENLALGREEIFLSLAQGAINASALYELGSGMELKQDYLYVEVGAGQGVYAWRDYNGNGVKELNEFEVAAFRDEALYVRVALPSREYVQAYTGQLALQLSLLPAALWQQRRGARGLLSRFSNTFAYSNAHKNLRSSFARNANPFFTDTSALSQTYAALNTLSYLSRSARTRVELSWQQNASKQLLINGVERRQSTLLNLNARQRLGAPLLLSAGVERSAKVCRSQYAQADRSYDILQHTLLAGGELTPVPNLRLNVRYSFSDKENIAGGETAQLYDAALEATCNFPQRGVATGSVGLVRTALSGEANSAVGYELLQGYGTGGNLTWGATLKRVLGQGLELSLLYAGRKLPVGKAVHSGGVELRLLF